MDRIKRYKWFLAGFAADFYVLPFLIRDTGSAIILLLVIMPVVCFCISAFYGMKYGFSLFLPLCAALLFVPSLFVFYNISAWVYAIVFGIVSVAGEFLGILGHRHDR